jgi:pimeloyl-ACP methyl ester carboxylesterase
MYRCPEVVTPLDLRSRSDRSKPLFVVHPGWQKSPAIHANLLLYAAENGLFPLGIDSRFTPANMEIVRGVFGDDTRIYQQDRLRRPAAVAAILLGLRGEYDLSLEDARFMGHSYGGAILTTLLAENTIGLGAGLVLVANSVGTGETLGLRGLAATIKNSARKRSQSAEYPKSEKVVVKSLGSAMTAGAFALAHPLQWHGEMTAMTNEMGTFARLDMLHDRGADVSVFHAKDDSVINFRTSQARASEYPQIDFVETEGGHDNLYTGDIIEQIIRRVLSK